MSVAGKDIRSLGNGSVGHRAPLLAADAAEAARPPRPADSRQPPKPAVLDAIRSLMMEPVPGHRARR